MLEEFSHHLTYGLLGLEKGTHLADAVEFFVYDTIKILFLLTVIIVVVSIVRSYLLAEKTKGSLSHKVNVMRLLMRCCLYDPKRTFDRVAADPAGLNSSHIRLMSGGVRPLVVVLNTCRQTAGALKPWHDPRRV